MKAQMDEDRCFFCGSEEIRIPRIAIAFSMGGRDYSFCKECLLGMTADDFWQEMFIKESHGYPPRLADWVQKAWDSGISDGEAMYPKLKIIDTGTPKKLSLKAKQRRKMSNALRYRVMRRDNFQCVLCGVGANKDKLVIDHKIPVSKGGKTTMENIRTLCLKCNSGKGVKLDNER